MADYNDWVGKTAYDVNSEKIGKVDALYAENDDQSPAWVTIKTGLFGNKVHFAPVQGAQQNDDGIVLGVTEEQVKSAPSVEDDEALSDDEEDKLYAHYLGTSMAEDEGHDTSGPDTDEAMTRSEEQLDIGKRVEETGRVKLRKYVVTENVTTTVPVSHEEVRIVREPITDANYDAATAGKPISEEEHELVLNAEVPVVGKTVVPKERIKLTKDVVTDEVEVNDQIRKEQIDLDQTK